MRPKRRALNLSLRALFWLAIGAALNVAIAWGVSIFRFSNKYTEWSSTSWPAYAPGHWTESPAHWPIHVPHSWPPPDQRSTALAWCGSRDRWSTGYLPYPWVDRFAWGFPFRSMAFYFRGAHGPTGIPHVEPVKGAFIIRTRKPPYHAIPLRPVWPEFIGNTLFYGALAFAALRALRASRRWWRQRAGHCGRCGYDLHGIVGEVCPECGTQIHYCPTCGAPRNQPFRTTR